MTERIRFKVYGRFEIDVVRTGEPGWAAYVVGNDGKRSPLHDLDIPEGADEAQIADLLDVLFHELARPGDRVTRVAQR